MPKPVSELTIIHFLPDFARNCNREICLRSLNNFFDHERKFIVATLFNMSVVSVKMDGYEETGAGNAGLKVKDQKMVTTTIALGGRWLGLFGNKLLGRGSIGEFRLNIAQDMRDDRGVVGVGFLGNFGCTQYIQGDKLDSTA